MPNNNEIGVTRKIVLTLLAHLPPFLRVEALQLQQVTLWPGGYQWKAVLMAPALQYLRSLILEVNSEDVDGFPYWVHSLPTSVQSVSLSHVLWSKNDAPEVNSKMLDELAKRLPHLTALDMAFNDIKQFNTALIFCLKQFSHLRQLSLSSGGTEEERISVDLIAQLNRAAPILEALEMIELRDRFQVGSLSNKRGRVEPPENRFDCATALQLNVSSRLRCASLVISRFNSIHAALFAAHLPAPLILLSVVPAVWEDYGVISDPLIIEKQAHLNLAPICYYTFHAIYQLLLQQSDKRVAILCETYPDRCRYHGAAPNNIHIVTARMTEQRLDDFFARQPNSNTLRSRVSVLVASPPELTFTGAYRH